MIDIQIDRENMKAHVIKDEIILKSEELDAEGFRAYMQELPQSDLMLDALRLTAKMMNVKSYTFKDVKI